MLSQDFKNNRLRWNFLVHFLKNILFLFIQNMLGIEIIKRSFLMKERIAKFSEIL